MTGTNSDLTELGRHFRSFRSSSASGVVKPLVTSEDLQQLIDYMERIWIGESISGRSTTPALAKLRSSFQASRQLSTGEE